MADNTIFHMAIIWFSPMADNRSYKLTMGVDVGYLVENLAVPGVSQR